MTHGTRTSISNIIIDLIMEILSESFQAGQKKVLYIVYCLLFYLCLFQKAGLPILPGLRILP